MRFHFTTALVLASLAFLTPRGAEARIIGRSPEVSIGRETAAMVENYFTVDTDPVNAARVRQIGRRLVGSLDNPRYAFEFHVVESGEVNAFALPGGYIYVFRGLLQLVPNDDALAFVLAHEVAHVTESHAIQQFEKNVLISAGISALLLGTGTGGAAPRAANVVQAVVGLAFSRHDETEADEHGIRLATKAGYNPAAAAEAMKIVKRAGGDKGIPALLRSHPAPDSRIARLTSRAEELLAQRSSERTAMRDLPPPPAPVERNLAGLDAIEVAACDWFPLVPGAVWSYRLQGEAPGTATSIRVLEPVAARPEGVFRVEYDLGRGVRATRLVAPAGDRYLARVEGVGPADAWRLEAVFAEGENALSGGQTVRYGGAEKITVPAGQFDALRVERVDADGKLASTAWYSRGVGLIKRVTAAGAVEELTRYSIPKR